MLYLPAIKSQKGRQFFFKVDLKSRYGSWRNKLWPMNQVLMEKKILNQLV